MKLLTILISFIMSTSAYGDNLNFDDMTIDQVLGSGYIIKLTVVEPGIVIPDGRAVVWAGNCKIFLKERSDKNRILRDGRQILLDENRIDFGIHNLYRNTMYPSDDRSIDSVMFAGNAHRGSKLEQHRSACGPAIKFEVVAPNPENYEEATLQEETLNEENSTVAI